MRSISIATGLALSIAALALTTHRANAQTLKATKVLGGFSQALFVCSPPADTARLFVVQQGGRIRIIKNGAQIGRAHV